MRIRMRMSKFMRISVDVDPDAELRYTSTNYDIKFIVHNKFESYIHRYESIMNIISMKDFYGYWWYVVYFAAFQFEFYLIFYC